MQIASRFYTGKITQIAIDDVAEDVCFYIDLVTGQAFKVDSDTDNLKEHEVHEHWDLVEEADLKEIK